MRGFSASRPLRCVHQKHYDKLQAALDIGEDDLRAALDELTRLNPKPGNSGSESSKVVHHVIPDFLLSVDGDDILLQLNGRNAPELRVSRTYREMMDTYAQGGKQDKSTREALTFVKQKWMLPSGSSTPLHNAKRR